MKLVKQLDRHELVVAVWAAEFTRCMSGAAVHLGAPAMHEMAARASESADRLVEALRFLIEVNFRVTTNEDLMTWEKFVAACQQGVLTNYDGYGELATEDNHVSNVRIDPSDTLSAGYARPDWATHVCWYNR